ncbi:MAG: hypothetical protein KDC98_07285, partial [Planctomycetes bacterium]|nr:hypothetical protein [Planctomycetota bacterium]
MLSGQKVYRTITARVAEARERLDAATAKSEAARRDLAEVRRAETRTLAELAKVRLGELDGDRIAAELDAADREALAQLADRDRERDRLAAALAAGARDLAAMMAQRASLREGRDAAAGAHESRAAATMQRLGEDDGYRTQLGHVEFITAQAAEANEKARRAEADRIEKGKPYEADKLFTYLWRRRYRFPEYRPVALFGPLFGPLLRALDSWVARLCGYDGAHRDYGMLLEIPVRLRAHADAVAAEAEAEAEKLRELQQEAMAADGVPELLTRLEAAQQELDELDQRIGQAEAEQDRLGLEQAAVSAGNDPWSARARQAIEAQLQREDILTLHRDAAATPTPRDDELVLQVSALRTRKDGLAIACAEAEAEQARAKTAFDGVDDLSRRFRRRDFESSNSMFDSDFDIGDLLAGILGGGLRSGDAWSTLRRRQRWRSSSSSSSSGGLFGGFGGSSRSSGFGGFGGGGFSSGG